MEYNQLTNPLLLFSMRVALTSMRCLRCVNVCVHLSGLPRSLSEWGLARVSYRKYAVRRWITESCKPAVHVKHLQTHLHEQGLCSNVSWLKLSLIVIIITIIAQCFVGVIVEGFYEVSVQLEMQSWLRINNFIIHDLVGHQDIVLPICV